MPPDWRRHVRRRLPSRVPQHRTHLLKYGKKQIDKVLLPLFQDCWGNIAVPDDEWSTAKITWLYKADDARKPGNYRGISLHSVLGKLYVSILNSRLTKFLETPVKGKKKISTHQNGFRTGEGRSCQEHILSLTQILRQRKEEKKDSFVFFQDFSKAFDLVDHSRVFFIAIFLLFPAKYSRKIRDEEIGPKGRFFLQNSRKIEGKCRRKPENCLSAW